MTDRELMQQALEALDSGVDVQMERVVWTEYDSELVEQAITALRERLAQPEQEPVFDCPRCGHCCPQRKPLTDEECDDLWAAQLFDITDRVSARDFIRDVEAAHGIKGEA